MRMYLDPEKRARVTAFKLLPLDFSPQHFRFAHRTPSHAFRREYSPLRTPISDNQSRQAISLGTVRLCTAFLNPPVALPAGTFGPKPGT